MPPIRIHLLGDVAILQPDGSLVALRRQQPRTVLTVLALERHRGVSRTELADLLWEGELPDHWAGAVRGVVSKVRAFLDRAGTVGWLVGTGDGWRLDLPPEVEVDLERCRSVVEMAEAAMGDAAFDACSSVKMSELEIVERALGSGLTPGVEGVWLDQQRQDVELWHRRSLAALVDCATRSGRAGVAVSAARRLVEADPFSDRAIRHAMDALVAAGDRAGALALHAEFAERLHTDLGVAPEAETEDRARILRGTGPPSPADRLETSSPLVGREPELATLQMAWSEVRSGSGAQALLVTGEPGSGKTRLAAEATGLVLHGRVLWGRCSTDRRVSFEPVSEAITRVVRSDPGARAAVAALATELAPMVPELGDRPRDAAARSSASDRSPMFVAAASALRALVSGPSVWVIDDVQWANPDTVELLEHMIGAIADLGVLVVFTSRGHDTDVAEMLTAVARAVPLRTVALSGLDVDAVTVLLDASGVEDAEAIGEVVRYRTGGNPFLIGELVRSVDTPGELDPEALPGTLRSWIDQRAAALDDDAVQVLAAAAVLGAELNLEVLAAMVGTDELGALERCAPLVAAGFLVEGAATDLSFAHALTRDAVHDGLGPTRLRVLHRRAADAWRTLPDAPWADVAGHLARAGSAADGDAVPAMVAAGQEALARLAWSSADAWFGEALERRPIPGVERVQALIGLGAARRGAGDRDGARAALSEACETASALGDARLVAEATLGLVGGGARGVAESVVDAERAALLRAALDGLGSDDDDLAVPLLNELALALLLTDRVDERVALTEEALARSRRLGRADLLAVSLLGSRVAHHGPEHAEVRLDEAEEVLVLGVVDRPLPVTLGALMSVHEDALLVGDRPRARVALDRAEDVVGEAGPPYWRWVVATWRTFEAIVDGDLERAEALAFAAVGLQAGHPEAMACLGVNLVDVRLFQGRAGEVVDLLGAAADDNPHIPCYRAVLALCLAESGDLTEAEAHFRSFAEEAFLGIPDDTNRLLTLAVLADVAATLCDAVGSAQLHELLLPHAYRQVLLNCFAGGGAYWGPVATQLGRLSEVLGDSEAACVWYDEARRSAEAFDAPLALARIPRSIG